MLLPFPIEDIPALLTRPPQTLDVQAQDIKGPSYHVGVESAKGAGLCIGLDLAFASYRGDLDGASSRRGRCDTGFLILIVARFSS